MNRVDRGLGLTVRSQLRCEEAGCEEVFFTRAALMAHLDKDHPVPWTWVDYGLATAVLIAAGFCLFTLGLVLGWWPR